MNMEKAFGIMGLTPGAIGIWVLVFGLAAWWVRGMADRRRAHNEGESADSEAERKARAELFGQMQEQLKTLIAEVREVKAENAALKKRIDELEARERDHLSELIEHRAARQLDGRVREEAAKAVAAEHGAGRAPSQRNRRS